MKLKFSTSLQKFFYLRQARFYVDPFLFTWMTMHFALLALSAISCGRTTSMKRDVINVDLQIAVTSVSNRRLVAASGINVSTFRNYLLRSDHKPNRDDS